MHTESAAGVWELLRYVREFIQHPRRLDPIINNKPSWYMLTSAMDIVSDTESAIVSYENGDWEDKGTLYLVIFGLLQAMYLQQDALRSMVHALEGSTDYKIDSEPEAMSIRQIRHDTVGYPTNRGAQEPKATVPLQSKLPIPSFSTRCESNTTRCCGRRTSQIPRS